MILSTTGISDVLKCLFHSYKITTGFLRDNACSIWYDDDIEKDGWGKIRVVTSPAYDDDIQAYCAG